MPHHEDKAGRYIALLDTARVNGSWSELPELIRKVNKHAPQRQTLIQTATAEHHVATITTPLSSGTGTNTTALTTLAAHIRTQSRQEKEDVVQGRTCLLWAWWSGLMSQDYQAAGSDGFSVQPNLHGKSTSTWTKICLVKSAYIEGTSFCQNGGTTQARSIFLSAVDSMQSDRELVLSTPQLAYWSEQLLAQLSINVSKNEDMTGTTPAAKLEAFRYWYVLATRTREVPASTYGNTSAHLPRSLVWREYYECISASLRSGYGGINIDDSEARMQQATDLRKVERAYENEILRSRKFPDATESNGPVERWVESVITNWHVLCGPGWNDIELGEGGRDAVARNVLDVLYRAATKTFHSTLILRRLFQVHKSLTEFSLAYKAFDTYIDLVERGRARAAKSTKSQPAPESTKTVLATMAEAIEGLCSFGRQAEARKAYELSIKLEDWLEEIESERFTDNEYSGAQQNGHAIPTEETAVLSSSTLELVHRAIGIAKAHWARWTPFGENRASLQEDALISLRKACDQHATHKPTVETFFATGLLLAETREITQAIDLVKQALTKSTSNASENAQWANERKSIPLWHLLALLLSARGEHDSATKSCVAAFEQFPSTTVLLGSNDHSLSGVASSEKIKTASPGLVADMECDELQRMIEIRITELALTELAEGPEEAVNCSNELLGLYSQLFSHLQISLDPSAISRNLHPLPSSADTVKSMRGSMFSRNKHNSSIGPISEKVDNSSMISATTRPSTRATQAPTIQITDEQGKSPSSRHQPRSSPEHHRHGHRSSLEGSIKRLAHRHSQREHRHGHNHISDQESTSVDGRQDTARIPHERTSVNAFGDANALEFTTPLVQEQTPAARQLPQMEHNLSTQSDIPQPLSHQGHMPQQDVRLPNVHSHTSSTSPIPRFNKSATQKHAITILIKIWLVIATLYRRASMFEDSREACDEATKAASKIEEIVGAVDQSARAFADAGWGGGGKSVDEIWADVHCERAALHLAIHERRVQEGQELQYEEVRTAVEHYEQCLMFFPNHAVGIVGLSNVLLDYYEKKVDLSKKVDDGRPQGIDVDKPRPVRPGISRDASTLSNGGAVAPRAGQSSTDSADKADEDLRKTPENLNRIAARDRAYGLLSTLTKLGSAWDNSEAWFALARAHELGGEVERAKGILWWCVELEDSKPIRHWGNVGYSI